MTAAMTVAAATLLVLHVDGPALSPVGDVGLWLLLLAFLAAEVGKVHLRLGRESHSLSLSEIPLVLALVFVSPAVLFATRAVGSLLAYAGFWRQRGVKLAWNLSRLLLETGLALTVHRAVLGDAAATSPRGWLAALAATVTVDVFAGLAVAAVLAMRAGREQWRGTGEVLLVGVAAATVTTSLALVGVLLLAQQPLAFLLLAVLAVVLLLAYRSHTALAAGLASLGVLHEFTRAVGRCVREQDVVSTTLGEARSLLRAEVAQLLLPADTGQVQILRCDGQGRAPALDLAVEDVPGWLRPVLDGAVVRVPKQRRDRDGAVAVPTGHRDVLAVPLRAEGVVVGALLVADRVDEVSTFDGDDQSLLETLAGSAGVALRSARLVEQLLDEADDKERRALHDPLTGLLNRQGLARRLDELLAAGRVSAVLHLSLDGLAAVRENISHEAGDALLVAATQVLVQTLPAGTVLARLSGDDLALVLADEGRDPSPGAAASRAAGLTRCFEAPVTVAGLSVPLVAVVGVALATTASDSDGLLLDAHAAGYAARDSGRLVHVHAAGPTDHGRRRLALVADLDAALRRGGIDVVYQPKASFVTGTVVGVEALARWDRPEHGPVSPADFVPLAESAGLVRALTLHVLDTALGQCAAWRAGGLAVPVAVNLSMRSLHQASLYDDVAGLLSTHGVPAASLVLEITEGSMMTRPEATLSLLDRLRGLGVGLSIDDFGTGYSSLAYLARMPVTELKIDKSFVLGIAESQDKAAIVRSTVGLAHELGLRVVAEGVEDVESWQALRELGCDVAQGYLLSRPLPASALTDWLLRRASIPAQAGSLDARLAAPAELPA